MRLIGKLIYLTVTRPDITFAVGVLSRYIQSLYQLHWTAACRILRYFKRAPGTESYYRPSSHLDIVGYFDAEWAGDSIDRHFITSYCTSVGGNLVI